MTGAPTATGHLPHSTTIPWCPQGPYVNGYVYTSGPLAPGSACWAPLLELRNGLCVPVVVSYESRIAPGQEGALCNRLSIAPKSFALITDLLPSTPGFLSTIRIEDAHGHTEAYTLEHSPSYGYFILRSEECRYVAPNAPLRCAGIELEGHAEPYVPQFGGCQRPPWGDTVIVPLRIRSVRCIPS